MNGKQTFLTSAVIGEHRVVDKFDAYTKKQAWYFFAKRYGYAMRDFNALPCPSNKDKKI